MKLWYNKPAQEWTDALPLGNGRVGAMVFGGTHTERFALNEDTLWSGAANQPGNNPGALAVLPEARRAALDGRYDDANELCKAMQGAFGEAYMPLGDLFLFADDTGEVSDYHRELDLDTAITTTRYRIGNVTYTREAFVSAPDQLMVVRISADMPGSVSLTVRFDSQLRHEIRLRETRFLLMTGAAPTHTAPNYVRDDNPVEYAEGGITFAAILYADTEGGTVAATDDDGLRIAGADAVTLYLSLATSFVDADNPNGRDPVAAAQAHLNAAVSGTYEQLRERHIANHQALFRRVSLDLGANVAEADLPTNERIRRFQETQDPALAALLFHYGRYLLIASSRAGTQPANLQGIWNAELRPPWSSNYTLNINAQMNYWLAETTNLSECHEPLLRFICELAITGAETARINYGMSGWTAHHNSDLWRKSSPVGGEPMWANWCFGGA
ncbi:MAG: glycoside hydrolase family 95 protein, partial [Armatimonadetes bacterium]|nr:glycoside hydrolase family 95 protein [Armatimonadota bacterium]